MHCKGKGFKKKAKLMCKKLKNKHPAFFGEEKNHRVKTLISELTIYMEIVFI